MNKKAANGLEMGSDCGLWLCTTTFGWQIIMLLFPQPIANISKFRRDSFVSMMAHCDQLYFCDL